MLAKWAHPLVNKLLIYLKSIITTKKFQNLIIIYGPVVSAICAHNFAQLLLAPQQMFAIKDHLKHS